MPAGPSLKPRYAVEGSRYVLAACAVVSQEMYGMVVDTPQKAF